MLNKNRDGTKKNGKNLLAKITSLETINKCRRKTQKFQHFLEKKILTKIFVDFFFNRVARKPRAFGSNSFDWRDVFAFWKCWKLCIADKRGACLRLGYGFTRGPASAVGVVPLAEASTSSGEEVDEGDGVRNSFKSRLLHIFCHNRDLQYLRQCFSVRFWLTTF